MSPRKVPDMPELYLRRLLDGGVIAIGGSLEGVRFGPSTRRLRTGVGEEYELRAEDLPEAYEEPTTAPGHPLVITAEEQAQYDAETAAIEAAKVAPSDPIPVVAAVVVETEEQRIEREAAETPVEAPVVEAETKEAAESSEEAAVAPTDTETPVEAPVVEAETEEVTESTREAANAPADAEVKTAPVKPAPKGRRSKK